MKTSAITAFILSVLVGSAVSRATAGEGLALEPRQEDILHEIGTEKSPLKATDTWSIRWTNGNNPQVLVFEAKVDECFNITPDVMGPRLAAFADCVKPFLGDTLTKKDLACMNDYRLNIPGKSIKFTDSLVKVV